MTTAPEKPLDPPTRPDLSAELVRLYALRTTLDTPTVATPAAKAARAVWEELHCLCGHRHARHIRRHMVGPVLVRACDDCDQCPMDREWTDQDRFTAQVVREAALLPPVLLRRSAE